MTRKQTASPRLEILEERNLLATCNVTRLADTGVGMGFRGDLRYCINKTNSTPGQDLIEFRVTGTIGLNSALPNINDDLVIFGPGVNDLTVQRNTGGDYRIFTVNEDVPAEIYNLTIKNGATGVGNLGTMTLGFVSITGNNTGFVSEGGGITNVGTMTVVVSSVTGNSSVQGGGGITNLGNLTLIDTTVTGNKSASSCGGEGGGILNKTGAVLDMSNSSVSDNDVENTNSNCTSNSARGAGIHNSGTVTMTTSTVSDNAVTCKSDQGPCSHRGGGVYNVGMMDIAFSTISGNSVSGQHPAQDNTRGGGIYNQGTLAVDSSTISGNIIGNSGAHTGIGGGIETFGGTVTIVNSTIANNVAPAFYSGEGGGIHIENATVSIRNSTIVGNFCGGKGMPVGGGIAIEGTSNVTIQNSIVVANFAATGGPEVFGVFTSLGDNIFGDPSGGSGYDSSDMIFTDPMLGPLADNGGPTQTFALLPGSPAFDAGNNTNAPTFDQRGPGFPRVVNGTIDIGSFEVQTSAAVAPAESNAHSVSPLSRRQVHRVDLGIDVLMGVFHDGKGSIWRW